MASLFDGRSLRRRVEQEARDLGGDVRPAFYSLTFAAGVGAKGSVRLDRTQGPFVLCGLSAQGYLGDAGFRMVNLRANAMAYTQEPVHSDALLRNGGEGWPRPVIVGAGDLVEVASADAAATSSDVPIVLSGFHTSPAAAAALRRSGELWLASQTLTTSAAQRTAVATTIVARDVIATHLLHPSSTEGVVDAYSATIGGRILTPTALRVAPPTGVSQRDPRSWVNLRIPAGSRWETRLEKAATLSMYPTLLGAAVYV